MKENEPIRVLMVEDDPDDVLLMRESLRSSRIHVDLAIVEDGEKALDYLFRRAPYEGVAAPDLILLDLNLPRIDGREVLRELKSHGELKRIPVVIMTTSEAEADIEHSYVNGANCYITKPLDFSRFREIMNTYEEFWFTVVKLPPRRT